jgi:hypothetical protein
MIIDVIGVRPLGGYKLEVEFSDATNRSARFCIYLREDRSNG